MEEVDTSDCEGFWLQWPVNWRTAASTTRNDEVILLFESTGHRELRLVSNYPYELWLDGVCVGDGGLRCAHKEVLLDTWPEGRQAHKVVVWLHYMNIETSSVCFRSLFADPFFGDLGGGTWTCRVDHSVAFGAEVCNQSPRQNIVQRNVSETTQPTTPYSSNEYLYLREIDTRYDWVVMKPSTKRCQLNTVQPFLLKRRTLKRQTKNAGANNKVKPKKNANATTGSSTKFCPEALLGNDILSYVKDQRPCSLQCDTYDLGAIALHRFEMENPSPTFACVLAYSEVPDFEMAWNTANRKKVRLADCMGKQIAKGAPFGFRGCRYLHVLYSEPKHRPTITLAQRRENPFEWREDVDPENPILEACRANLVASVDGGLVDTCWRERTQWVGDARMAALAIRALTHNTEIVDFVVRQIASSYDNKVGMVAGAFPYKTPSTRMFLPTFHLQFCLCAIKHGILEKDDVVRRVVLKSVQFWKHHYLQSNHLIAGMPGWCFVDWDFDDNDVISKHVDKCGFHAVCNALFHQVCCALGMESGIDVHAFNTHFWTGTAYKMLPSSSCGNIHATAIVLGSSLVVADKDHLDKGIRFLNQFNFQKHKQSVTLYFGYFIAKAFEKKSRKMALEFIHRHYMPIAKKYGTLYEKHSDEASMARGWSVGIASIPSLVGTAS